MFRRRRKRAESDKERPKPAAPQRPVRREDLSGPALNRWLWSYSLQHPATIIPAALSAVAVFFGAVIEFNPAALAVSLAAGALSVISWGYNYFLRGVDLVKKRQAELKALLDRQDAQPLQDLVRRCEEAGFNLGAKEARELNNAYEELMAFLDGRDRNDLGAVQFRTLARSTLRQGNQLLQRALELHKTVESVNVGRLERELAQFKTQRAQLAQQESKREELAAMEQMIATHSDRLAKARTQKKEILTLISKSNELEGVLETSHLTIAGLGDGGGSLDGGDAAENLRQAVEAARRVEASLGALHDTTTQDRELEDLGRNAPPSPDDAG